MTLFRIEKVSRGWFFSSVIRTSFLSCSCFFLLLVEVEGVGNGDEEGKEDEVGRSFFSLSAKVSLVGATSLRRALTSSTSPFRTSFAFFFSFSFSSSYLKGFSPNRILRV